MAPYADQRLVEFVYPFLRAGDVAGLAGALSRRFSREDLLDFLSHPSGDTVKVAIVCLSLSGRTGDYEPLARLLHHDDPFVVDLVERALWGISFRAGSKHQSFLLRRAVHLVKERQPDHALLLLNRVLVENPGFAEACFQRALVHHLNGDYGASIEDCRRAVELNPSHFGARAQMGHAYAHLEEYAEALECYYAALSIHPRLEGLHEAVRCLRWLLARSRAGRTPA